jgi:hypothetical protein
MNTRIELTVLSLTVLSLMMLLAVSLEAQVGPSITVDNKPDKRIEIVPIDNTHRSLIPLSLTDALATLPSGSFILVNHADTPITAVVARWTYTDTSGEFQQSGINCDAYMFAPLEAIVKANDLSLITPYGCASQDRFPRLATGGGPLVPHVGNPVSADPSMAMHLYVDSVLFEDGQIWGPDKLQYHLEIQDRYSAVQKFVAEVAAARSAGEGMPALLERIRNDAKSNTDPASARRAYYAGLLQRSPNSEGTLEQLKAQTPPPTFRHIGEQHQ